MQRNNLIKFLIENQATDPQDYIQVLTNLFSAYGLDRDFLALPQFNIVKILHFIDQKISVPLRELKFDPWFNNLVNKYDYYFKGEEVKTIKVNNPYKLEVQVYQMESLLLICHDLKIDIWDLETWEYKHTMKVVEAFTWIKILPNYRILCGSQFKPPYLYNFQTHRTETQFSTPLSRDSLADFLPDGTLILGSQRATFEVWSPDGKQLIFEYEPSKINNENIALQCVKVIANRIVTLSKGELQIWDFNFKLIKSTSPVNQHFIFPVDSKRFITHGFKLSLWDLETGELIFNYSKIAWNFCLLDLNKLVIFDNPTILLDLSNCQELSFNFNSNQYGACIKLPNNQILFSYQDFFLVVVDQSGYRYISKSYPYIQHLKLINNQVFIAFHDQVMILK